MIYLYLIKKEIIFNKSDLVEKKELKKKLLTFKDKIKI